MAKLVLDAIDQRGRQLLAAVVDLGVGVGQAKDRGFAGAQSHRQDRLEIVDDPQALGHFDHFGHANRLRDPDGHQIARLLQADPQRRGAEEIEVEVGRLP